MKEQLESDEIYQVQTENRHLKDTIVTLRDELEKVSIAQSENIQKAVASANDEIVQLKATISALREELEHRKIMNEEKLQEVKQVTNDEINQLQLMIRAQRDQIETHHAR